MTAKKLDGKSDTFPSRISSGRLDLVLISDASSSGPLSQYMKSMNPERLTESRRNVLATVLWCGGHKVDLYV